MSDSCMLFQKRDLTKQLQFQTHSIHNSAHLEGRIEPYKYLSPMKLDIVTNCTRELGCNSYANHIEYDRGGYTGKASE